MHILIAALKAGAVEGAHGEVIELDTQAPSGSSDQVHEGWLRAVEAIAGRLAHIADRTLRQAQAAAAALETPSAAPSRTPHPLPPPVDSVGEEQVHRVLEAAERIFVFLTGYTGFDRDLSEEILTVEAVSAEQQEGYVRQLEASAEASRDSGSCTGSTGRAESSPTRAAATSSINPRASWSASAWTPSRGGSKRCGKTKSTQSGHWTASPSTGVSAWAPHERNRQPIC
ncbi:hypothetical protein [Streptomyces canus]|uniref:hypothetical protein n=1 Tax=Streptomyces canus TaxID=58343 RepID=UPI0037231F4B